MKNERAKKRSFHSTWRSPMIRMTAIALSVGAALGLTGCVLPPPPPTGPTGLYLDMQPDIVPVMTPTGSPITWGSAPNIDPNYGKTLYAGTGIQQADSRPALVNGNEPLRMWEADPHDGRTNRPAIIWLHGGGFAVGIDSMAQLASSSGAEYAKRGYVGFSVEYRTDSTLVPNGTSRPPSLCQWVRDNEDVTDPLWVQRKETCKNNMIAAQRDVQAFVRYLRAHASEYGIDPNRIAVGGFSAGAVLANLTAYRSDDVGNVSYFAGDDRSASNSRIQAGFGASGCLFSDNTSGVLPDIGAGDAPVSLISAKFDGAVDYRCVANSVLKARAAGLEAELTSYCASNLHAANLYAPNKAKTDTQWTQFLARELQLRTDIPASVPNPVCPL